MTIMNALIDGELKVIAIYGEIKYEIQEIDLDPNTVFRRKKREEKDVEKDVHLQA